MTFVAPRIIIRLLLKLDGPAEPAAQPNQRVVILVLEHNRASFRIYGRMRMRPIRLLDDLDSTHDDYPRPNMPPPIVLPARPQHLITDQKDKPWSRTRTRSPRSTRRSERNAR